MHAWRNAVGGVRASRAGACSAAVRLPRLGISRLEHACAAAPAVRVPQCQLAELKGMACAALGLEEKEYEIYDYRGLQQGAKVGGRWDAASGNSGYCWLHALNRRCKGQRCSSLLPPHQRPLSP